MKFEYPENIVIAHVEMRLSKKMGYPPTYALPLAPVSVIASHISSGGG